MAKSRRVPSDRPDEDAPRAAATRETRCAKCGSTRRGPYRGAPRVLPATGLTDDGHPYTRVILRTTRCAQCGQSRVDRAYA